MSTFQANDPTKPCKKSRKSIAYIEELYQQGLLDHSQYVARKITAQKKCVESNQKNKR